MTQQENWPKVAVVGAGAVGGYFGGRLARAGAPVVMIGRPAFVEAVSKNGLFLDTLQFQEGVRVEASTELSRVRGAEIVLFCVKTTDNATTARALAPLLVPGALVLSMQNGVDNVEQIRAAAAIDALPAVVYVAASAKLVWNCALNAVSALGRAKYGLIASSPDAWKVVETAVYEVLAVARAAGVHPPGLEDPKVALAGALKIATQMAEALSSTGQDLNRGKCTEIESLNGYISRRGAELGVPTPVNHALYALVKLAEGRS